MPMLECGPKFAVFRSKHWGERRNYKLQITLSVFSFGNVRGLGLCVR